MKRLTIQMHRQRLTVAFGIEVYRTNIDLDS
jgi:hypothetical protein